MPIAFQTRLAPGATFGANAEVYSYLQSIAFTDLFTAPAADADGTAIGAWASLGGTTGTGAFSASGGDRPVRQTRDGLAVLRSDGSKVMAFTGTLPTTGCTIACRFHHTRDVETKARFVLGNNAGGADGKSLVAQTTISAADSEVDFNRQYLRFYTNATPTILDSQDAIVRGNQWFSALITFSTSRMVITIEGGGLHAVTNILAGTFTTNFASLFAFARSATPGANGFVGDIRHLWIAAGDKHADPVERAAILNALKRV